MNGRVPGATSIGLVWAQDADGVIGTGGGLPWHLPEDLAHFRDLTTGSTVVMGRVTWESLPARFRPLPDRSNVVLTRAPQWSAPGATVTGSLSEALMVTSGQVWVIGGATVYREAIARADRLEVTEIDERFAGDAHAPRIDGGWQVVGADPTDGWHTSRTGLRYRFVSYAR